MRKEHVGGVANGPEEEGNVPEIQGAQAAGELDLSGPWMWSGGVQHQENSSADKRDNVSVMIHMYNK